MRQHIFLSSRSCLSTLLLSLLAASCAEKWEGLEPETPVHTIEFSSVVSSSSSITRADGTIVNKNEATLPASRTIISDDGLTTVTPRVGLFGYYTGLHSWADTVTTVRQTINGHDYNNIEEGLTPDYFYNTPLTIEASTDGRTNLLHYDAHRMWPNANSGNERLSFWAYYPYNPTSPTGALAGELGIDFNESYIGDGTARGRIRFRMNKDASKNVDFLVSDLVTDETKARNPLLTDDGGDTYYPTRIPLTFRHMLAQVRLYANISHYDRIDAETPANSAYWSDDVHLSMSLNNIHLDATYTLTRQLDTSLGGYVYPYENSSQLGSVTVSNYVENPYWFKDRKLNEDFMYGYFEDVHLPSFEPGDNSSANLLGYQLTEANADANDPSKHYNYAPQNIILAVPQRLLDENIPSITLTLTDRKNLDPLTGNYNTARVTVNMLGMNITWEMGFIYSYAFIDALKPGDDIVRGPENIDVAFDSSQITGQW